MARGKTYPGTTVRRHRTAPGQHRTGLFGRPKAGQVSVTQTLFNAARPASAFPGFTARNSTRAVRPLGGARALPIHLPKHRGSTTYGKSVFGGLFAGWT